MCYVNWKKKIINLQFLIFTFQKVKTSPETLSTHKSLNLIGQLHCKNKELYDWLPYSINILI